MNITPEQIEILKNLILKGANNISSISHEYIKQLLIYGNYSYLIQTILALAILITIIICLSFLAIEDGIILFFPAIPTLIWIVHSILNLIQIHTAPYVYVSNYIINLIQ